MCANILHIKKETCTQGFFTENIFVIVIFFLNLKFFQELDMFLHLSKYLEKILFSKYMLLINYIKKYIKKLIVFLLKLFSTKLNDLCDS